MLTALKGSPFYFYFFHLMFSYDKSFDPKIVLGHCDLISWLIDFALYLGTQLVYAHFLFHSMFVYDKTYDPKVVQCHCDLILWFGDFALYFVNFHTSFRL